MAVDMPGPNRGQAPGGKYERNAAIRAAYLDGATSRELATGYGLTVRRVQEILERGNVRKAPAGLPIPARFRVMGGQRADQPVYVMDPDGRVIRVEGMVR